MNNLNQIKKIYYPNLPIHTYMKCLINKPPRGYKFILNREYKKTKFINLLKKSKIITLFYKNVVKSFFNVFGILNKLYYDPAPKDIDLILSTGVVIKEKKPWIMKILDTPFCMAGNDYNVFIKNLSEIEKSLSSKYCKRIIVHTKLCKYYMRKYFSKKVINKIVLVNPAIPSEEIKSNNKIREGEITFLFIGSINNPDEFLMKGGLEALETFKLLKKKYQNIKLIIRCKIPEKIKRNYLEIPNITFLESNLSIEELKKIYEQSDILLMPGYGYFIMAFLESFMKGLPIISLNTFGVSEFIVNGKTGFYVEPSNRIPIHVPSYPANVRSKNFSEAILNIDKKVVENLAKKSEILINNPSLLLKMSRECQKMFKDKYSFDKKIVHLKNIFDRALKK